MSIQVGKRIFVGDDELEFTYARSSGAGGQNVNKTNSKAILRWRPFASPGVPDDVKTRFANAFGSRLTGEGELILASETHRDQPRNAAECLEKLRSMLEQVAQPPKPRKKTKPTYGSKQRRLATKRSQSDKKKGRSGQGWD